MERCVSRVLASVLVMTLTVFASAQEKPAQRRTSAEDVALSVSNPTAGVISMPFQNNLDYGIGRSNGTRYLLNFQPVIPFLLSSKLRVITRTIIPVVDQRDVFGRNSEEFGLSDAIISLYFSPTKRTKSGIRGGPGPVLIVPTATHDRFMTRKWAAGPTLLLLRQKHDLTYGFLAYQAWSFAGDDNGRDINRFYLQPFFIKTWKSGAGVTLNSEMTFNWVLKTTVVSFNPLATAVTKLGDQAVQLGVGPRIPLAGPREIRPDFGIRAVFTLVFAPADAAGKAVQL